MSTECDLRSVFVCSSYEQLKIAINRTSVSLILQKVLKH